MRFGKGFSKGSGYAGLLHTGIEYPSLSRCFYVDKEYL